MTTFKFAGQEFTTQRVIGEIGNDDGPVVIFIGGIHGNEPTGVIAIQQAFEELRKHESQFKGRMLGLAGNLQALSQNRRFVVKDLNRIWNQGFLRRRNSTNAEGSARDAEDVEQAELFDQIDPFLKDPQFKPRKNSPPKLYIADLHTTSAKSVPFVGIDDQLDNRNFALKFPVPTVLGIEEYVAGALLSLLSDEGHVAMAFEAGQHDDPMSIEIHKAFVFCALENAGVIPKSLAVDSHAVLERAGRSMGGILEVVYRRWVTPEDRFEMKPGYENFSKIKSGEVLATDRDGPITANRTGRILMPLYQKRGNDGYFIVRRIPRWALALSKLLRGINFDGALTWLPGVSRSTNQPDTLVVNKRIARFLANEVFHLLGYRRKKDDGEQMIVSRREIEKPE